MSWFGSGSVLAYAGSALVLFWKTKEFFPASGQDKRKGIYVEGLSEWIVRTPREIYDLMKLGGAMR